jgi:hypothetical protein
LGEGWVNRHGSLRPAYSYSILKSCAIEGSKKPWLKNVLIGADP